jgi:hypothetical protein
MLSNTGDSSSTAVDNTASIINDWDDFDLFTNYTVYLCFIFSYEVGLLNSSYRLTHHVMMTLLWIKDNACCYYCQLCDPEEATERFHSM